MHRLSSNVNKSSTNGLCQTDVWNGRLGIKHQTINRVQQKHEGGKLNPINVEAENIITKPAEELSNQVHEEGVGANKEMQDIAVATDNSE